MCRVPLFVYLHTCPSSSSSSLSSCNIISRHSSNDEHLHRELYIYTFKRYLLLSFLYLFFFIFVYFFPFITESSHDFLSFCRFIITTRSQYQRIMLLLSAPALLFIYLFIYLSCILFNSTLFFARNITRRSYDPCDLYEPHRLEWQSRKVSTKVSRFLRYLVLLEEARWLLASRSTVT